MASHGRVGPLLAAVMPGRERRKVLLGVGVSVLVVVFLCRGLVLGSGGYELYVDPALPASGPLLRGVCEQSLSLWSNANLGARTLYPAEYLACGVIVGAVDLGVPAPLISRWLPILALVIASLGMFSLLLRLRVALPLKRVASPPSWTDIAAALATALLYACSPYSFTEMVAGHWLYLTAIAAFPWCALVLMARRKAAEAVFVGGLLLAVAYVQLQFMIIAPVALLVIALLIGSRRFALRSIAAAAVGVIPHLPWMLPLLVYRPAIQIGNYLIPGTDARFSINPVDSLRLVGYITPFAETAVKPWFGAWYVLSFGVLFVAMVGLFKLPTRRVVAPLAVVALVILYESGVSAPGYASWSPLIPAPVAALFRERYALSFIPLVFLCVSFFAGMIVPRRVGVADEAGGRSARSMVAQSLAALGVAVVVLGAVGPFLDGHLGPYGTVREQFATATALTQYIDAHGGGSVLTIPFGSIIKGHHWQMYGRSPFSLGGPPGVLDAEGVPTAAAMPFVQALADSLNLESSSAIAYEYMRLLNVTYVVEWKTLDGDSLINRSVVIDNLKQMGARSVWSDGDASLWRISDIRAEPPVVSASSLLVVSKVHEGAFAESQSWHAQLATSASGNVAEVARAAAISGGYVHLADRNVTVVRHGPDLTITEQVYIANGGTLRQAGLTYHLTAGGAGPLEFGDGTTIPEGGSGEVVAGPLDSVYRDGTNVVVAGLTRMEVSVGSAEAQLPTGIDLVIEPPPGVCPPGSPTCQAASSNKGVWVADRHGTDPYWQLQPAAGTRSGLLADGIGATWFVEGGRPGQGFAVVYPPGTLFSILLKYVGAMLVLAALGVAAYSWLGRSRSKDGRPR